MMFREAAASLKMIKIKAPLSIKADAKKWQFMTIWNTCQIR